MVRSWPNIKTSNGSKIARIAPILTIFWQNESQRHNLSFFKIWFDVVSKNFEKFWEKVRDRGVGGMRGAQKNPPHPLRMLRRVRQWSALLYSLCSWRSQRRPAIPPTPPKSQHRKLISLLLASKMALLASKIASRRALDAIFGLQDTFFAFETLFFRFISLQLRFFLDFGSILMAQTTENINFS